jgi:vesicle coat complex subunit
MSALRLAGFIASLAVLIICARAVDPWQPPPEPSQSAADGARIRSRAQPATPDDWSAPDMNLRWPLSIVKPRAAAEKSVAEERTEELISALNDSRPDVRREAAAALALTEGEHATMALATAASSDDNPAVRTEALYALGAIGGERSLEALLQALTDPDVRIRQAAVDALSSIGEDEAAEVLAVALDDADAGLRVRAVAALGDIRGESARYSLERAAADPNASVREAAADLLVELRSAR